MKDDLISRDFIKSLGGECIAARDSKTHELLPISSIDALPSAQPDLDEWCTDCKEYDPKRHSCPRYNKVIREALNGAEPRKPGRWNFIGDNMFECTSCGVVYTTEQLNGLRNYDTDPYAPRFCPSCGADMRGEQNEKKTGGRLRNEAL